MTALAGIAIVLVGAMVAGCSGTETPPGGSDREAGVADRDGPFRVAATIQVGKAPHGIRFGHDGDTAYVALSGEGAIGVVDLTLGELVRKLPAGTTPLDLIRTPEGAWVVTQFRDSTLVHLDARSPGAPVDAAPWQVGSGPSLFAPGIVRGRAHVVSEFADRLTVLELATGVVLDMHPTGDRPYPADVMPDGSIAFVPNLDEGTVSVIDLLAGGTVASVDACAGPPGGALTRDGVSYVVACGGSDGLVFINTASFEVVARVDEGLGPRPFSIGMTRDGRYGVVINAGGSTVSILDVAERRIVQELEVGEQPIVVRAHPDGRRMLVSNEVSGTLVVLEPVGGRASSGAGAGGRAAGRGTGEVVVLGMIHGDHRTSDLYGLDELRALIREIDPDYVLVEIPPNRFEQAAREFRDHDEIREARVVRFPEYVDVLFPLTREMDFEIVPTAGWNQQMSDFRAQRLSSIPDEPAWTERWAEYETAIARSAEALAAGGDSDDPRWIHTEAYDEAQEIRLSEYNRLFNDELGPGGWDYINSAHYAKIARALDELGGEGKRFLITYGAGHKGWFLRELRKRDDIELLEVAPFLDAVEERAGSERD